MFYRTGDAYGPDGRPVDGVETSVPIVASVQRLSMRERQLLPEGFRAKETLKLFIEIGQIQLIENQVDPLVDGASFEYKNKRYDMIASERWDYLIPHYKITVVAT